jgi:hypothetical protein
MSKKAQLILFVLMTIIGSVLSLNLLFWGGLWSLQKGPGVLAEISRQDGTALAARAKQIIPTSVIGRAVFLGTLYSYRRYHHLAFPK